MPASEWCCKRTNSLREPSPKTFAGENRMPRKKNSKWQPGAAEAHEFICSLPAGYDTLLGRGGINLSGGQKQRICIARALLRKPKILILDDSTSAVDSETELRIRNNLNAWLRDTTVLIITQRIYTMQSANRVILLDDGEIESIGTPEELLERSEMYREIYYSQQIVI